jgi:hypothetical protein
MSDTPITDAINEVIEMIWQTSGHPDVEYMSSRYYNEVNSIAQELGISFGQAKLERAKRIEHQRKSRRTE